MRAYVVKLSKANSPTGVAYIGPDYADGFKASDSSSAYCFGDEYEAERFASHWRRTWHGFAGFSGSDIIVEQS